MRSAPCLAAALFAAAASPLSAETNHSDRVFTNAPVVVSASRTGRTADEIPANVAVITAGAIQDAGVRSVPEALERLGGIYFRQYSGNPGQSDIALRGFGENSHGRVLVLVDGQRLNNADMSAVNWLNVPVSSVERIELIRGGQTALYGNYAVAGVVNILTREDAAAPVATTTVSAAAGSDDTYGAHVGTAGSLGIATRYTADADWQKSGGYRANSDYETADLRAAVTEVWSDRLSTTLGAFYNRNEYGMPGYLNREEMRDDPRQTHTPEDRVDSTSYGGHLRLNAAAGAEGSFDLCLNASRRELSSDTISWSSLTDSTLETFSAAPRLTMPFDVASFRNLLTLGVDAACDRLDSLTRQPTEPPTPTAAAKLSRWTLGGYFQNDLALFKTVSLILGGRIERCGYEARINNLQPPNEQADRSVTHTCSALDAALLVRPTAGTKLYARAATLYRYPFLDEMAVYSGWGPPAVNTDLDPEHGVSIELGAAARFARDWAAELSVYQLDMSDEIAWDGAQNTNLDETRRRGLDAALTWKRAGRGLLAASYAWVDAAFAGGPNKGRGVPLAPARVLTLRGELEMGLDLALLAGARVVDDQALGGDIDHSAARLPGYATLDFGLRFTPRQVEGLQILVSVDNAFDRRYANMAFEGNPDWGIPDAYYPAVGRAWRLTASYRF